ncbi:amino acid adenylation domain-containing protein [Kamptonema animale CS-326]|jgi:amino acid adenylation domain-containing protein|uniref:non-ribosomal peptide synthetase n=1 Tax=Kamptonema animale TaxID=92934 RepID=UPI00232E8F2E|nr:non-ribosomal peptide synthetase [Kamptonema animale]MDB9510452.1 amino acid adenylation domain-containing protein [Kamptonema animale CS-326]
MTVHFSNQFSTKNRDEEMASQTEVFVLPVSFGQQRMWILDQLETGNPFYNHSTAVRLTGQLNITALEQSFNEIVRRHEVLRTTFTKIEEDIVQVIRPSFTLSLPVIDLRSRSQTEQELEIQQLATEDAQRYFNLTQLPLLRLTLIQLNDEEYVLLLTMHHIIADGWSQGVIVRELAALYEAFGNGKPSPLTELSIQYADFAIWQRDWMQGKVLETQLNYWKQQLTGAPPLLELPSDRPRPLAQSFRGCKQYFSLSKDLALALKTLSLQKNLTVFMTLLAAFQIVLSRYSDRDDILVGTPVANRKRAELEQLIGLFVNTVVLRTNLADNPTFVQLLERVRKVALEAYAHQDLPFEKLVEELQPDRNLSYTPLFQVMFVMHNAPMPPLELSGLTLKLLEIDSMMTPFDLSLHLLETTGEIVGWVEYNTDLFEKATIQRFIGHFQTLLAGIVSAPETKIAELPLLTELERQELATGNNTETDYPKDVCIHQLFEAQVERSPDAIALVFEDKQLTYKELNQRANQLAHHLHNVGVSPEVMVGICVERSLEMVVGLLGILKAGGAYVPLDPAYPPERLAFMLQDAQVPVLLTQGRLVKSLPKHQGRIVCLDTDWEIIERQNEANLISEVKFDNLAYVIYTSGSTGKPKGVAIEHRNAVALLDWARQVFTSEDLAGVLASTSICFDLSVFELFVPLSWGGKVILAENALHLPTLSAAHDVTLINTVPSAIAQLVRMEGIPSSVRTVNLAGEPLPNKLVQQVYEHNTVQQVFNLYGPSEDTTYSTYTLVKKGGNEPPSIGRPIANTQVYILDAQKQLVPIGVPGELYIGGAGLARGYLNRPELTSDRFIPNPFNNKSGSRLYKTGDLARYSPDGNIEFLGRIDQQVKIRGFRIELGEIEAVLQKHPAVHSNLVLVREDHPGEKRLVAYIILQEGGGKREKIESESTCFEISSLTSNFRSYLKQKLPEYMLPAAFVILDKLPLTPNGKVDRRALPAPEMSRTELEATFIAPRTPIEEMLAGSWADILRVEKVGINNNFFELGGHSLLATQLISRVRTTFGLELPLRRLFEQPTVASFADCIETALRQGQAVKAPPIVAIARDREMPLSFAQTRLWFLEKLEPGNAFYNIPAAVYFQGKLNINALEKSIEEIINRHEVLRTNLATRDGQAVQIIAANLNIKLSLVDLQNLPECDRSGEIQRLTTAEARKPFNLELEPLIRVTLLHLAATENVLLLTIHHIIADGWSMGIFAEEFATLYQAFCIGNSPELSPLPIQYADFAVWQRQWFTGEVLAVQLSYWKQQLAGAPTLLELPTNRPRPAIQTFQGAHQTVSLSQELSADIANFSRQAGVTLFMALLAAFQILLYRYSNQTDVLVGTPVANRNRAEIEGLIGFFVNTLVLRSDLSNNPTFTQVLERVRNVALEAYAHQDIPFEQLVDALQPERSLSYTPLFQVMFVLQNTPLPNLELSDLNLTRLSVETQTSKFDLTLSLESTAEGIKGYFEYNTDLFDADTISRMAEHFQTLLGAIVVNPNQQIDKLPLLSERERYQLLMEWSNRGTQDDRNPEKLACLHQLFEAQVELNPDAVALVFAEQKLTYQELNSRANQLAHYLQKLGVKPEVLVGICVERSLETIVGILGILKAGGAYVPLDPANPCDRLAFMLEDAAMSVILTQQQLLEMLPTSPARVVCLDADWQIIVRESEENLNSDVAVENLAYVIYTSGSTGKPKGVLVPHANVVRLFTSTQSWYQFNERDVWTLFHSYAFDFSVWEIWGALIYGGRLVIVPYLVTRSPEAFYQLLCQEKVTILNQTPSAFRQLMKAESSLGINPDFNLRLVIFGGEALELQSLKSWFERHGDRLPQLVNMYGITETTVHVTYRPLKIADLSTTASVIGCPIPDLQVYLLDRNQQPLPIGIPGEMYVGGAGVARGYLNRPELTAERFISNPFSDNPEARLYKSGDLARYLANGDIEYLGRIDDQVKIRGFRIELGEIEALLAKHPGVREAVVLVREDRPGDQRLVAYAVAHPEHSLTVGGLRSFLKEKLPDYMVPVAFVILAALPLTINGKLDRRSLPAPDLARPELEENYQSPRTTSEKLLAEIWAQVLGLEKVGIHDNFFTVGGDSIRSIQVQSLARERGLSFSVQQQFQYQTICDIIEAINSEKNNSIKLEISQPFSLISPAERELLPDGVEDAYPLALLQLGMLFWSEYSQKSATYHDIFSFRLKAPLDLEAFQNSLQHLANSHAVLRTSFHLSGFSEPLQLVYENVEIPLQIEDLRQLSNSDQKEAIDRWLEAEKKRPFNWEQPPLLRFHIHCLNAEIWQLNLSFHHVILDGWSVASMLTELFGHYLSRLGEEVDYSSPYLNIQFRDFVALERANIASGDSQQYWTQKLSGCTIAKLYRWSLKQSEFRQVRSFELTLEPELYPRLKQLAQSAGVPVKSVLLAAHLRVLSLLSGESDVLTGLVSNGRPEQMGGDRVLGLFLNTLPLRLQLSGGTWIDLVRAVFEAEGELLPHRRYPLAEIQKNMGGQPLFETAFNFVHFHVYQSLKAFKNVQILEEKFFEETNFPLMANFSVNAFSTQLNLTLQYDAAEFGEEQIQAVGGYYDRALAAMAQAPFERYETRSLLSPEEQHQVLVEWNHTATDYPQHFCLHQLWEAQVERTPDAIAAVFEGEHLTYRELNRRANQLAHYLQRRGVGPEVLVGICAERSLELVVGLLGILKAGGAYVPLDPGYPPERLAFMLEDAQTPVLLTQQHLKEKLSAVGDRAIYLDADWNAIGRDREDNPNTTVTPENLAYVIYTSGSTGKPKGAMNTHQGICNRLLWMQDAYKLTATDRVLQKTPLSFDVSVWEFFWPLIVGARLVLAKPEGHRDSAYLAQVIASDRITTLHFVPSMLQLFLEEPALSACNCLKRVICSGEALPFELQDRFFSRLNAELHNLYGPTEAAVDVTFWACGRERYPGIVPIGRPIANTQIYLLDPYLKPVPIGVAGELHIGGIGLGRGYLNRPELTSEKFISNPFAEGKSAAEKWLYKTGDLARYLPDGNIEFIGRIDHQVKLRGFRIELGEIESAILTHQSIQQAAITVREERPGDKYLAAYVVANGESPPASRELRQFLKEKLPDYMVPAVCVFLEQLPLTPNGKIDRKLLPNPAITPSETTVDFVMPSNEIERKIATIWQQILNLDKVGINDNFFDLGGHSLLAIRIHSQLRQMFSSDLSIIELFRYPTVYSLAERLSQAKPGLLREETDDRSQQLTAGKSRLKQRLEQRKRTEKEGK